MARKTRAEGRNDVRHEIRYERFVWGKHTHIQAVCSCGRFTSAAFWARERAEAAGEDHILGLGNNGKKGA